MEIASPVGSPINLQAIQNADSSNEDSAPAQRIKRQISNFCDSDSDVNMKNVKNDALKSDSESESDTYINKSILNKPRNRITLQNDTDSDSEGPKFIKNKEQQMRMKNKSNKIKEKFKSLLKSRKYEHKLKEDDNTHVKDMDSDSTCSDEDISSIGKIKQKIKERTTFMPSLCDPDTSDEEHSQPLRKSIQNRGRKSIKSTSPKPMRISAKQAIENMHKIKSESNRMLREKEVSLPYHRPKALTLKDMMSRRKPALNAEGKALPIKMNEVQLKEYASLLEQRQKEMMELCKSDTDEENEKEDPDLDAEKIYNHNFEKSINDKTSIPENGIFMNNGTLGKDQPGIDNLEDPSLLETIIDTDVQTSEVNALVDCNEKENCNIDLPKGDYSNSNAINNVKTNNTIDHLLNMNVDEGDKEKHASQDTENYPVIVKNLEQSKIIPESESQLIHLQFDSETIKDTVTALEKVNGPSSCVNAQDPVENEGNEVLQENKVKDFAFSDDEDLDIDDIDKLIENAEILKETHDNLHLPHLVKDPDPLNVRPKLTGAPGSVIDLDITDPVTMRKLVGVELLKERFSYFARIKTDEELEKEKVKKLKPGSLHLRLKQQLEDQIAEQRSLEWAKRLEEEKQHHLEMKALRGEESDGEDDIEKVKLEDKEGSKEVEEGSCSSDDDEIEDDVIIKDKPKVKNVMIADEAEESDCDEDGNDNNCVNEDDENVDSKRKNTDSEGDDNNEDSEGDDSDDESSEEEITTDCKKGRILKAFEDSDDEVEDIKNTNGDGRGPLESDNVIDKNKGVINNFMESETYTQDDDIQLAQNHKSQDLFTSQESDKAILNHSKESDTKEDSLNADKQLGVFSIANRKRHDDEVISETSEKDPLISISETTLSTQTQSILPSQIPTQQSQSQPIGEDVLALCTGNFYDNEFISQSVQNYTISQVTTDCDSQELTSENFLDFKETCVSAENNTDTDINEVINKSTDKVSNKDTVEIVCNLEKNNITTENTETSSMTESINKTSIIEHHIIAEKDKPKTEDGNILKSILDELNDPEFDSPKPNKYFVGNTKNVEDNGANNSLKKRFVIDSDDDANEESKELRDRKKKKKLKKKKPEKRALQISDDEEDDIEDGEEEYISDLEDNMNEDDERVVEYDSEENEVEVNIEQPRKKKRKVTDFFEQEAELTSEDEWVGSGDEDEAGLDRMEREEGDDEKFNQRQLQRELEQIHMRDVLDQDKREVRIIQELLFEDGDLGAGSRQRKFRWKNADGEEETGVINEDFTDTQEEEFESEEQWRKQRHEREVFLRQMKNGNEVETHVNICVNRTSLIKANLSSKSMSSVLLEASTTNVESIEKELPIEKKNSKDIPSPKKAFTIFQQNYHGSLLTRGRGALARLAALATPLAVDDDGPKLGSLAPSSKRNFVFAALSQEETKVTKRKAENVEGTPKLVKKMKLEEKQKYLRSSLLDHMKV